jgi:hypothetical protein
VIALISLPALVHAISVGARLTAIESTQIEADWRRQDVLRQPVAKAITSAEDAAGAVDGTKNGRWGFHTEHEANPWWEVDLGEAIAVAQVVIWNRCDEFASRNDRIQLWLSVDGQDFRMAYQHEGPTFLGQADGRPLVIALEDRSARYVRLTLPAPSYLHLDEVEIFGPDRETNLAFGKPARQSSISPWSARALNASRTVAHETRRVLERGHHLASSQARLGADVTRPMIELRELELALAQPGLDQSDLERLHLRARWTVRTMVLANPLLDFNTILFVKRAPTLFPHMSDQHYDWWSRPGGGVCLLEGFKRTAPGCPKTPITTCMK